MYVVPGGIQVCGEIVIKRKEENSFMLSLFGKELYFFDNLLYSIEQESSSSAVADLISTKDGGLDSIHKVRVPVLLRESHLLSVGHCSNSSIILVIRICEKFC